MTWLLGLGGWLKEAFSAALRGDVIGTWKSFAVAAFAFWLGSSSGGKAKPDEPVKTEVVNRPNKPVFTEDVPGPRPEGPADA